MRVGIATDHGGFGLKEDLVARLRAAGHDVVDFGADELSPDSHAPRHLRRLSKVAFLELQPTRTNR
jgi:ribose 5-phosphate isomerase B